MKSFLFFASLALFPLIASAQVQAPLKPDILFSVGDSITAGALAKAWVPIHDASLKDTFFFHFLPRRLGFKQLFNEKTSYSWATGSGLLSHSERLSAFLKNQGVEMPLAIQNLALSGAKSSDLDREADSLLATWNTGNFNSVQYLTLFIGTNDVCAPSERQIGDEAFKENLRNFFRKMATIQQATPLRILVAGLQRLPDLGLPEIANHRRILGLTCRGIENRFTHYCDSLTSWQNENEYETNLAKIDHANEMIESVVSEMKATYPHLDLVYTDILHQTPMTLDRLAIDCFHPNRSGQEKIAEDLWNAQPWFK